MLGAALTVGVSPIEVKEIVYEAVPYVGMAKVFDLLHATIDVLTEAVCVTFVRLRAV
jgi:4-carboxymuconolactone decarboxylase